MPILLRRICCDIFGRWDISIREPWRVPRSRMIIPAEIERVYRALATGASGGGGGVLVILDQDDDQDAAALARSVAAPMVDRAPLEVVVACREYQAWFLGGVESLRTHPSVRDDARFVGDPESPRDAKGRLEGLMHEPYRETLHQPRFSKLLSIENARLRCPSFDHLVEATGRLLSEHRDSGSLG